jgi:CheY-like chemotaxis protein
VEWLEIRRVLSDLPHPLGAGPEHPLALVKDLGKDPGPTALPASPIAGPSQAVIVTEHVVSAIIVHPGPAPREAASGSRATVSAATGNHTAVPLEAKPVFVTGPCSKTKGFDLKPVVVTVVQPPNRAFAAHGKAPPAATREPQSSPADKKPDRLHGHRAAHHVSETATRPVAVSRMPALLADSMARLRMTALTSLSGIAHDPGGLAVADGPTDEGAPTNDDIGPADPNRVADQGGKSASASEPHATSPAATHERAAPSKVVYASAFPTAERLGSDPGGESGSGGGVPVSRAEAVMGHRSLGSGHGLRSPRALALDLMSQEGQGEMIARAVQGNPFGGGLQLLAGEAMVTAAFADAAWAPMTGAGVPEAAALAPGMPGVYLTSTSSAGDNETQNALDAMLASLLIANRLSLYPSPEVEPATLLLVESEEETRDAMTVMLFKEGYQVLAVATGRDAWNVLRSPFSPIDGVLLDVHLPDIDGVQLVQRLREIYPTLPVFTWGNGSEPGKAAQLVKLGVQHLTRMRAAELGQLIQTVRAFLRGGTIEP